MSVTLTYNVAVEFLSFLRVDTDTEPGDLQLLCLQGMSPTGGSSTTIGSSVLSQNDNAPDIYNDTIALVYRDEDGTKQVKCLVGTIEPGKYYTQTEPNPAGAAHLTFGQHLYKKGEHKGYPALRSVNEVNRVWRDKDGDFKPDIGEVTTEGVYGTNVHAGGKTAYIGKYSAGCVNIAGGVDGLPYRMFLEKVNIHSESKPVVRVTLWRGGDLVGFTTSGWQLKPTLILGMKNQWVAEMQRLLKAKGYAVSVDGDWREKTTQFLVDFQKVKGLTPDGWCGPKTWVALST